MLRLEPLVVSRLVRPLYRLLLPPFQVSILSWCYVIPKEHAVALYWAESPRKLFYEVAREDRWAWRGNKKQSRRISV